MKKALSMFVIFLSFKAYGHGPAMKISLPDKDIGTGPAISYLYCKGDKGYAVNYDTSISKSLFTASLNLKYININNTTHYGFQTEYTVWLYANIGGGAGYMFGKTRGPIFHGFIGCPFGNGGLKTGPFNSFYVEPYYRINYFKKEFIHEIGIMTKITTYSI